MIYEEEFAPQKPPTTQLPPSAGDGIQSMAQRAALIAEWLRGGWLDDLLDTALQWVEDGIETLERITQQIIDIFLGLVVTPINEALQDLKDWFTDLVAFRSGTSADLADLQSKTQALEGVIGYAHGYCDAGISVAIGAIKYGVDNQVGPIEGAVLTNGAYYLGSKGLWVADARVTFDPAGFGVGEDTEVLIRVFDPSGNPHFIATNVNHGAQRQTLTLHVPFTVPSAGYRVELWVAAAIARNVQTGSKFNGLSVEKRSTETS